MSGTSKQRFHFLVKLTYDQRKCNSLAAIKPHQPLFFKSTFSSTDTTVGTHSLQVRRNEER